MITEDEIYNTIRRTGIVVGGDCDTLAETLHEEISSRTCENCKYFDIAEIYEPAPDVCSILFDHDGLSIVVKHSDYCNKFERKDK